MYELTVEREFSAAHNLRDYDGACARMHGHNYLVQITVGGPELNSQGLLVDFGDLKVIYDEVLGKLDHQCLNEVPPFDEINPTSENLARHIYEVIAEGLPEGVTMRAVKVFESSRACATYSEGD